MRRWIAAMVMMAMAAAGPLAAEVAPRPGWQVLPTGKGFEALVQAVKDAVKAEGLNIVTEAGPTAAAAAQGVTIPGNRVIGVFHVRYALRILPLSTAAMIEAPVRLYVTEAADGTATLSWKTPSLVFAPYADEGGAALAEVAAELDAVFARIGAAATAP